MATQKPNLAQRITKAAREVFRTFAMSPLPGRTSKQPSPSRNTIFRRNKALANGRTVETEQNTLACGDCGNKIYVLTRESGTTRTARFEQRPSHNYYNIRCVDEFDFQKIWYKFERMREEHEEEVLLDEKIIEVWEDENANSLSDEDKDGEKVVHKVRYGNIECVKCEGEVELFCYIKSDKEGDLAWSTR